MLPWTDGIRQFQHRVTLAVDHRPEVTDGLGIDDASLISAAHEIFSPWLNDAYRRRDIDALDLSSILRSTMTWDELQAVEKLVPST